MAEPEAAQSASQLPGRTTIVRGLAASNAQRSSGDRAWGVRFGSRNYPDYAKPDPRRWDGEHGGSYLSPDEADALAEGLQRAAAWARAQELVKEHADAA